MSTIIGNTDNLTMGSDESEDEWVCNDEVNSLSTSPVAPSAVGFTFKQLQELDNLPECPKIDFEQLQAMDETLYLQNFINDTTGFTLYRDEPYVNKQYPGLELSSLASEVGHVFIAIVLYFTNGNRVPVRVPDIKSSKKKSKQVKTVRHQNGLFVDISTLHNNTIFFKKKSVDKQNGNDTAFELGKDYSSHTMGVPSQFVFYAVPFVNGTFVTEKAQRSQKFFVKSKRQERFLPQSKKRRKKNVEHLKIITDIEAAEETYRALVDKLAALQYDNQEYTKILSTVKSVLPLMRNGAVHIALTHGTRPMFNDNTINL